MTTKKNTINDIQNGIYQGFLEKFQEINYPETKNKKASRCFLYNLKLKIGDTYDIFEYRKYITSSSLDYAYIDLVNLGFYPSERGIIQATRCSNKPIVIEKTENQANNGKVYPQIKFIPLFDGIGDVFVPFDLSKDKLNNEQKQESSYEEETTIKTYSDLFDNDEMDCIPF